jgi:nitrous oxidase accessory protein NosD
MHMGPRVLYSAPSKIRDGVGVYARGRILKQLGLVVFMHFNHPGAQQEGVILVWDRTRIGVQPPSCPTLMNNA